MKTMTCRQMGGPCDVAFQADTADEVIKAQDKHLKEMVAKGDETHSTALEAMKKRWRNPIRGMGWYMKTKKDFSALPDD
jgi:predicted small metal-binding protein